MTGPDKTLQVEPKVMQVLMCLVARPGRVVTREHIMQTVWDAAAGSEDLLTRCISELRKAFKDDSRDPSYIETIRKRGYRLIVPVRPAAPEPVDPVLAQSVSALTDRPVHTRPVVFVATLVLTLVLLLVVYRLVLPRPAAPPAQHTPVTLTAFPGQERDPAFAPEGDRVAFAWQPDPASNADLFVKPIGAEQALMLRLTETPEQEVSPAWSPDGNTLAFLRRSDTGCALYTIPASGGKEHRMTSCDPTTARGLAWSPDGRWLAFSDRAAGDEPARIVLLSVATLERRVLTNPPIHYHGDSAPAFSPDGTQLAFTRDIDGWANRIVALSLDDLEERELTSDHHIAGLTWSADGQSLIFSSDLGGNYSLWRIPRTGGTPEWITLPGWMLKQPAISPAGELLAYEQWNQTINIWHLDTDTAATSQLTRLEHASPWDMQPSLSPNGRQLAFVSGRSGQLEVWTSDLHGEEAEQITELQGPIIGTPRWSPDAEHLVFDARPDGHGSLFVVDLRTKSLRRLTSDASNDLTPSWSHDGQWIYFSSDRSGTWEVWKLPASGGEAVQVTQHGGYAPVEAADGTTLYYSKPGQPGLWSMPVVEGVERQAFEALGTGPWALTAAGVYFIQDADTAATQLARFNFETRRVVPVLPLDRVPESLSATTDGRRLFLTRAEQRESALMLLSDFQ